MDKEAKGYPFGWPEPRGKVRQQKVGRNAAPNTAKPRSGANRRGFLVDPPSRLVNQNDSTK